MSRKNIPLICNNAGFTLLEIIAVMVIMSILAVVAVPKYFDLQAQARLKAMDTAMAEAVGRVNGYFAQQVLDGSVPSEIDYDGTGPTDTNPPLGTNLGDDFSLSVVDGGKLEPVGDPPVMPDPPVCSTSPSGTPGCIYLTITATSTALSGADPLSKSIPRPGSF